MKLPVLFDVSKLICVLCSESSVLETVASELRSVRVQVLPFKALSASHRMETQYF